MGKKWTEEQKQASRDAYALRVAYAQSGGVTVAEQPQLVAEPVTEKQCIYCGTRFDSDLLAEHQFLMHKGDMPTEEVALPAGAEKLGAGATVRAGISATSAGIPMKTPWSKQLLENGWECDDPADRVMEEGGWRYIPDEGDDAPLCLRCGGTMHKLSEMQWYDVPENGPPFATFQKLNYALSRGEPNRLPSAIVNIVRDSMAATKAGLLPMMSTQPVGLAGQLVQTGYISDDDDGAPN